MIEIDFNNKMQRINFRYGATQYSRRKAQERERKIMEFQMAIQRQGRSLSKLMEEKQSLKVSEYHEREQRCEYQHEKQVHRRTEEYQQVTEIEEYGNAMDKHQLDYLQSSHYEKYLERIMTAHNKQIDNSKKIDIIRSKNTYLQQHFKPSKSSTQQKGDKNIAKLEQKMKQTPISYYKGQNSKSNHYQKDTSKVQSPSFPTITCLPYLENNSISEEINDHKDYEMSGVSTTEPTCWNEPLRNITIFQRNERKSYQDLQNVKTVAKQKRQNTESNQQALRPFLQLNSQSKQERNLFIESMLRQQKENKQPITLKTPQPPNKHTIKSQHQTLQPSKTPMKRSNLSQTNQRQIENRPNNTSFTQITKKKQDHSHYTVQFKLERPEESRRVVRSSSAIGLAEDRCYLTNKSQNSIKSQFLRPS